MPLLISLLLISAITAGQLIKIPTNSQSGLTILDISTILLNILLIFLIRFKLPTPPSYLKTSIIFILLSIISLALTPLKLTQNEFISSALYIARFSVYLLLGWVLLSPKLVQVKEKIPFIFLISGILMAILGLLQFIFIPDLLFLAEYGWDPHYFRTVSTLLDPNFMGTFFALILLLIFLQGKKLVGQRGKVISFIIVYIALITTFSRGAALMFLATFLTLSFIKKSPKIALIALILTAGFGLSFLRYTKDIAEPRNIDRKQSAEFRLNSWQEGLTLFQQHPILGIGFNAYKFALKDSNLASSGAINSRGGTSNDSSLIFVAATTGVIGLTAYLYFLFTILKTSLKEHFTGNIWGTIIFASFSGLLIQSFFANSLFYPWFLIWLFLTPTQLHPKSS